MLSLETLLALALFGMLLSALVHAVAKLNSDAWGHSGRATSPVSQIGSRTPLLQQRRKNKARTIPNSKSWWQIWGGAKKSPIDEERGPEPPALPPRRRQQSLEDAFAGFDETHAAAYDDVDWTDEYITADQAENERLKSLPRWVEWKKGALPSMPESFEKKYELVRTFPCISCAPVHFVKDRITGEDLVVKQLKCRHVNGELQHPNEAKIVSQHLAPHPNIMAVKDVHIAEDGVHVPYANVVMEHCKAGDLYDFLDAFRCRGTQVPAAFILHFAASMIDALAFIHAGHTAWDPFSRRPIIANPKQPVILHCDIKPDNVFMQWHDTSKYGMPDIILADFGLAALESDNVGINGTPAYWAPEVGEADLIAELSSESTHNPADWAHVCSTASDMYSFAMTLFELMTLRLYRPGEDLVKAVETSTVALHEEILIILQDCLIEEPQKRQTAAEFHCISHAFKQRLQNWVGRGDSIPDHVWPAKFLQSRDGIAPASSCYSVRSGSYGEHAVAGAEFCQASGDEMSGSDQAAADLMKTLKAMEPGCAAMASPTLQSRMSRSKQCRVEIAPASSRRAARS